MFSFIIEQIDRIDGYLDSIHSKLDRSEKLMRDIESLPAYIGSTFSKRSKRRIMSPQDRNVRVGLLLFFILFYLIFYFLFFIYLIFIFYLFYFYSS